jgi:hypothetical protein
MLKKKQLGTDDPMSNLGIMSLNNHSLPYKKPILKNQPGIYVNTRGVLQEIRREHGGLTEMRSSSNLSIGSSTRQHLMLMAGIHR